MMSGGEDPARAPSTAHGQPALPGSSPCTKQNCPNIQSSRATLPSRSGAQLHPPQGTQGTVCDLKDITVPCPGIRDHLTTRYASQSCKGTNTQPPVLLLQNPSVPEMELSTGSSPQAQVLYPEGRARDAREQESPATSLRLVISPGSRPDRERHKSIILLAPPDHKRNPVPLYGTMLSARAQRSHKHSKKACVLSVSLTWAQTGRTQEILSHSQCWSSNDGCPHKGKPSLALKLQPRACPAPVQHLESLDSQQEIPTPTNSYTRQHSSTTPSYALGLS